MSLSLIKKGDTAESRTLCHTHTKLEHTVSSLKAEKTQCEECRGRDNTQDKYITETFICSHVKNEVDPMIQSPVASPLAATAGSNSFLWDFVVSRVTVEEMLHRL